MRQVFVERGVGMAFDAGAAAWSFDLDIWGDCHQGRTVEDAMDNFRAAHGPAAVVELIEGDELTFERDHVTARVQEVTMTQAILRVQRARARSHLDTLSPEKLDRDDPTRDMPRFARWRTIRMTLQHIADTESRYYLPSCGLPSRSSDPDLATELLASAAHVRATLDSVPLDLVHESDNGVWTATKLLRRLAWHERGELDAIDELLAQWSATR